MGRWVLEFIKPTWKKLIIFIIIVAIFSISLYLILGRTPFWYAVETIAMEPAYSKGDLIFISKTNYDNMKIGDVVVHSVKGLKSVLIMRVIEKDDVSRTYTTRGDNNLGILAFQKNLTEDTLLAKVVFKIPIIGYLEFIHIGWLIRAIIMYLVSCLIAQFLNKKRYGKEK